MVTLFQTVEFNDSQYALDTLGMLTSEDIALRLYAYMKYLGVPYTSMVIEALSYELIERCDLKTGRKTYVINFMLEVAKNNEIS